MRSAFRAIGAGMVLALQEQGSCPPLSPNLVCTPPPPTDIKADGGADTAHKISAIALPLSRAARAERGRASPLEGLGGAADQGGRRANRGASAKPSGRESPTERAKRGARDNHAQAPDRNERPPLKGARETGVFDRLDARLLKQKRLIKTASLLTQMSERSELHISGRVKKSKDFSIFFN